MTPSDDILYYIHRVQAFRLGVPPRAYADFQQRLVGQGDTDLTQLLPPKGCLRIPFFHSHLVYASYSAQAVLGPDEMIQAVERHVTGNWGEVNPKLWMANEQAAKEGGRLCSAFRNRIGLLFWVITNEDRTCTTLLVPQDTSWFPGGIPGE